ncbi:MAG: copper-binding protein [bacterium]
MHTALRRLSATALTALFALGAACAQVPSVTHHAEGVVRGIEANGQVLVIQHKAIPGYMDAMTMPFELGDVRLAKGVKVGDLIRFTITQKGEFWPITSLKEIPIPRKTPGRSRRRHSMRTKVHPKSAATFVPTTAAAGTRP